MKSHYPVLIGTMFLFISTTAVAHDDERLKVIEAQLQEQQSKIGTLLETVASQEEVIGKLHKTVVPNIQPVGSIIFTASETALAGYLYCDGAALSRTEYSELFATIGTTWGKGDGSATFNLPDMRGEFVRVWSKGHSVDSGRKLGQAQGQATAMPNAKFATDLAGKHYHYNKDNLDNNNGLHDTGKSGDFPHVQIYSRTATTGTFDNDDLVQHHRVIPGNVSAGTAFSVVLSHNHSHKITLSMAQEHAHPISGGDAETRPRNQALSCFIKAFSNSAF